MAKRKNPNYPPWHCFTVRKCPICGERYEPICKLKHICKKQNSYPIEGNVDRCVSCGAEIPEGAMMCPICERRWG